MAFAQVDLKKFKGKGFVAIASVRLILEDTKLGSSTLQLDGIKVIKGKGKRSYEIEAPCATLEGNGFLAYDLRGWIYRVVRTAVLNRLRVTNKLGVKRIKGSDGTLRSRVINGIGKDDNFEDVNSFVGGLTGSSVWKAGTPQKNEVRKYSFRK